MRRLLVGALLLLAFAAPAQANGLPDAGAYLARSLDSRGCAREPGGTASANLSAWVALGLIATGRSAAAPARCIEDHSRYLRALTDVELAVLALAAARRDPRNAGGRDLVRTILAAQRNGRIGPLIATNQFGILALRAAGAPVPASARRALVADQRPDGAWPVAPGGDGDSNLTATGIQAAIAAGVAPSDPVVTRALAALGRFRSRGGYALARGAAPDAQSTAWALQGLAAVRRADPTARAYLAGLEGSDGAFAYQRGVRITPVWVTAQSVLGVAGRAFPLRG